MGNVRIASVENPPVDPRLIPLVARLSTMADAVGLVAIEDVRGFDLAALQTIVRAMALRGVARQPAAKALTSAAGDSESLAILLDRLIDGLEKSPLPDLEWDRVSGVLGDDLLASLLGVSLTSVQRYRSGSRATPDEVAQRLHFLALIMADLLGAYNEIGVRDWFRRRRSALQGKSPVQLFRRAWSPDDDGAQQVRFLARSLTGSPAT